MTGETEILLGIPPSHFSFVFVNIHKHEAIHLKVNTVEGSKKWFILVPCALHFGLSWAQTPLPYLLSLFKVPPFSDHTCPSFDLSIWWVFKLTVSVSLHKTFSALYQSLVHLCLSVFLKSFEKSALTFWTLVSLPAYDCLFIGLLLKKYYRLCEFWSLLSASRSFPQTP